MANQMHPVLPPQEINQTAFATSEDLRWGIPGVEAGLAWPGGQMISVICEGHAGCRVVSTPVRYLLSHACQPA
jgi:hypothetical protein